MPFPVLPPSNPRFLHPALLYAGVSQAISLGPLILLGIVSVQKKCGHLDSRRVKTAVSGWTLDDSNMGRVLVSLDNMKMVAFPFRADCDGGHKCMGRGVSRAA